jgi:hypothetical protein
MFFRNDKKPQFFARSVDEFPVSVSDNIVYVVGEKKYKWLAVLRCPCGCQDIIQLNLLSEGRDQWKVTVHRNGAVTVRPSIWRTLGCKSHFTIKKGQLNWFGL